MAILTTSRLLQALQDSLQHRVEQFPQMKPPEAVANGQGARLSQILETAHVNLIWKQNQSGLWMMDSAMHLSPLQTIQLLLASLYCQLIQGSDLLLFIFRLSKADLHLFILSSDYQRLIYTSLSYLQTINSWSTPLYLTFRRSKGLIYTFLSYLQTIKGWSTPLYLTFRPSAADLHLFILPSDHQRLIYISLSYLQMITCCSTPLYLTFRLSKADLHVFILP